MLVVFQVNVNQVATLVVEAVQFCVGIRHAYYAKLSLESVANFFYSIPSKHHQILHSINLIYIISNPFYLKNIDPNLISISQNLTSQLDNCN